MTHTDQSRANETRSYEQWDIVTGVGLTALMVAAGRAVETHRENPLIRDPYAVRFVEAASPEQPVPTTPEEAESLLGAEMWTTMSDYMALRTRYLDEYLLHAGTDQIVILAAGLDTRGFRLGLPEHVRLFEVDQPKVLEFKQHVLSETGATPSCAHAYVPADLRDDWVGALRGAGFDPTARTAWLAEGLLPYLPPAAEDQLFEHIDALSPSGSKLTAETIDVAKLLDGIDDAELELADQMGVDVRGMFDPGQRRDQFAWLRTAGWQVRATPIDELERAYDRTLDTTQVESFQHMRMLEAERP